jgi:hypothetical protein
MSADITITDGRVEALHNSGLNLFQLELDSDLPEGEAVLIVEQALEPYTQE